jgi:hypothetical protein
MRTGVAPIRLHGYVEVTCANPEVERTRGGRRGKKREGARELLMETLGHSVHDETPIWYRVLLLQPARPGPRAIGRPEDDTSRATS